MDETPAVRLIWDGGETVRVPPELADRDLSGTWAEKLVQLGGGQETNHVRLTVAVGGLSPLDLLTLLGRPGVWAEPVEDSDHRWRISAHLDALFAWQAQTRHLPACRDPDIAGRADLLGDTLRWFGHRVAPAWIPETERRHVCAEVAPVSTWEKWITLLLPRSIPASASRVLNLSGRLGADIALSHSLVSTSVREWRRLVTCWAIELSGEVTLADAVLSELCKSAYRDDFEDLVSPSK